MSGETLSVQESGTRHSSTAPMEKHRSHSIGEQPTGDKGARGWSTTKKAWSTALLGFMTLALTFTSTAYSSSAASLEQHFRVSREVVTLGVSLFVIGFSVGPLLFGPLSSKLGYRPVYIGSYIAFTAFSFGASECNSIVTLLVMRFLAGSMGSSSLNNVPASYREMSNQRNYGRYFAAYCISAFGGPGLGGFAGAYADANIGWRWNLRIQAILVAASTIACILTLPEMSAQAMANTSQQRVQNTESKSTAAVLSSLPTYLYTLVCEPFSWLKDPVVAVVMVYMALLYAIFYGFFVSVPFAFQDLRGYSLKSLGLVYLSLVVGFTFGFLTLAFFQHTVNKREFDRADKCDNAPFQLETLLVQALWGALLIPVGLFLFAWTAPFAAVHFIVPCIGIVFFCWGCCTAFTSILPYLVNYAGRDAASLLALATFSRSMLAAAFPLFVRQMCFRLTLQGAMSLLGGLLLLLSPLPFMLYRYGPVLRSKSKRVRQAAM